MAERSIQETFKEIGLKVSAGEPVIGPSRVLTARADVMNRQHAVASEILRGEEGRTPLDATGLRLFLSQGIGARGIIEFPKQKGPWTDTDSQPKRAYMTVHPDSIESSGVVRLKVFTSPKYWTKRELDPRAGQIIDQDIDDIIGATATLGRGAHKSENSLEKGTKRDTVETTQPAHTALVLATSFEASRVLEKANKLPPADAPHLIDNELKPGASGFTSDLTSIDANDPSALTDQTETIYPPLSLDRMEAFLRTQGQGLNAQHKSEYNFYAFLASCNLVVETGQLKAADIAQGELVLPRSVNPESVVVYQSELFVGLARKGTAAVDKAISTMERRKNLTQW